ncbi:MAG: metallophosphoesterase [Bacteroidales bacterium]|jgi:predicted MPP superfamily phosphohydrolase|nr:metallophosphoesterase [Bacteroidales bacterium]
MRAFELFMVGVILTLYVYIFYRLWRMMPPNIIGRTMLISIGVFVVAAPFIAGLAGDFLPKQVSVFISRIGTSCFFILIYFLLLFLIMDLFRITRLFPIEKFMYNNWLSLVIVVLSVSIVMVSGYCTYLNKKRIELNIVTDKLETGTDIKIVAISDLHLGNNIGSDELKHWVDLINKENPDIVLIAGDIVDNVVSPLYKQKMDSLFREIKSRYGVFTIMGNHEYFDSHSIDFINDAGITLLRDSAAIIDNRFYVVGRDDKSKKDRKTIDTLIKDLDSSKPIILLDHQPTELDKTEKNNIDLQISGHTHYGQIFPLSLITKALYEKPHGYLKKGNSHIYVSSGIGIYGGKFRIGTRSEYVVIHLRNQ